jgi:hypothetical protein
MTNAKDTLEVLVDDDQADCFPESGGKQNLFNRGRAVLIRLFSQPMVRHIEHWPPNRLVPCAGHERMHSMTEQIAAGSWSVDSAHSPEETGDCDAN